ncbi:MAG: alkaline phosphatase family protein [Gemmatimonadetes bacterium]|nr:alkaline phosphatase family protein [Gemmatimonadota bacterium]
MRISIRTRLLALLLAACATAGCSVSGAPLGEVAELVATGGTKPLRKELRPIRGTTRALVFAIDGLGLDDLDRALREGRMPRTAALLGDPTDEPGVFAHAYGARDVLSILPSTTLAAWTAAFTGVPAAQNGVPGNEWWARGEGAFYGPVPVSFMSNAQAIRMYTDRLLDPVIHAPTVFERLDLRSHVSMLQLQRGADLLQLAALSKLGDLFEQVVEEGGTGSVRDPDVYRETDETSVGSVISDLRKHGVPDLQVVYLGGLDLVAHQAEQPLETQQRYLAQVVDPRVGRVLDAYAAAGAMDDTYVVFVSDHGHTPVLPDDRHALSGGDGEPTAVLESAGFRVRPFGLRRDAGDFQAVLAYQGAVANVYLADRARCPNPGDACEWARPPRLQEDVLPVARAFFIASRDGAHVPEMRGTLDLVFARPPAAAGEAAVAFQVFDGERLVPVDEWVAANARPDLLRLAERIRGLSAGPHGDRAGDVLLLARTGIERPIEERFYFGLEGYHSWHGGAGAQDSRIPLIVAHPRMTGAALRARVAPVLGPAPSLTALTPLLLELLRR